MHVGSDSYSVGPCSARLGLRGSRFALLLYTAVCTACNLTRARRVLTVPGTESSKCKWLVRRMNCGAEAMGSAPVCGCAPCNVMYSTSPMHVIV